MYQILRNFQRSLPWDDRVCSNVLKKVFISLTIVALTPTLPRSIIPADGLSARAPSQIPNAPVTNRDKTLEAMQRAVFYKGFSARELVDIGAWPDLNAVPSTLTEYIE